jgi:hypothetical protein
MYAVKFEAEVRNGSIKIPQEYEDLEYMRVEVVALVSDREDQTSNIPGPSDNEGISDDDLIENRKALVSMGLCGSDALAIEWHSDSHSLSHCSSPPGCIPGMAK